MTTLKAFYDALIKKPNDWDLRLVFADFLEEQDLALLVEAQRWMVSNQKHAVCIVIKPLQDCWIWGQASVISSNMSIGYPYRPCLLDDPLFKKIVRRPDIAVQNHDFTPNWKAFNKSRTKCGLFYAETALANALQKLKPESG